MKYVIYARKSSEDDKRQALSIPAQIRSMKEIAQRDNIHVVKVFQESKSAKTVGREVFNEMMQYIEDGHADAILCWKIDRLARNAIDEGIVKHLLQSGIIKIIKTSEKEFYSEENAIFAGLEFSMAIQYSRDLSKNVKRGNREKLKRGWWPSGAPFGYLNAQGEKSIIIDKERAPLLKYAFERYAQGGISFKELNNELYNKGLRTKGGHKLTVSALHHKLQNPFYCGEMIRNGESFQGKHEIIVSRELFDLVQSVRKGINKKRGYKHFFPYRGFLVCDRCGCSLTADKKKGHTYYYCTNGKGICDAHRKYIRSEEVDRQIVKKLSALRFNRDVIDLMHQSKLKFIDTAKDDEKQTKERLRKALEQCIKTQDRLFKSYDTGKTPETVYVRKIKLLEQEQIHLEKEIAKKVTYSPATFEPTKNAFLYAHRAKNKFLKGNDLEKRELLENLLSNITFEGEKVSQIQYKRGYQLMANTPKNASFDVMLGQ